MKKNFITVPEIAKDLSISTATIYRRVRLGMWPAFDRAGGCGKAGYTRTTYAKLLGVDPECLV